MKVLITGANGLLGKALSFLDVEHEVYKPTRKRKHPYDYQVWGDWSLGDSLTEEMKKCKLAFLCAGTKGTQECEGNRAVFRSDVDGNIQLARELLKQGAFVVFVSTDAVETSLNTAYARNRMLVELAIGGLPNVAIFRPGRFTKENVGEVAKALAAVGLKRKEGLTRWP